MRVKANLLRLFSSADPEAAGVLSHERLQSLIDQQGCTLAEASAISHRADALSGGTGRASAATFVEVCD